MKLKELKSKNGMRKKMTEHATFNIGNLQEWVKKDLPVEKASQDKNKKIVEKQLKNSYNSLKKFYSFNYSSPSFVVYW